MALVMAQEVPTSSSMAVPHGPAGVGEARRTMREGLRRCGVSDTVVDDAVLILSELLSNSCRHGRPLDASESGDGAVRAAWRVDAQGALTVEVTDGGGPTRPVAGTPSVTARGGRGLNIIGALAQDWGVRDGAGGEVTVWVLVAGPASRHAPLATRVTSVNGSGAGAKDDGTGARRNGTPRNGAAKNGAVGGRRVSSRNEPEKSGADAAGPVSSPGVWGLSDVVDAFDGDHLGFLGTYGARDAS